MKQNIFKVDGFIYVTSDEDKKLGYPVINIFGMGYELENNCNYYNLNSNTRKLVIATNNPNLPIQQLTEEEVAYCEVNDWVKVDKTPLMSNNGRALFGYAYKLLIYKDKANEIISICGGEENFKKLSNLIPKEKECNFCSWEGFENELKNNHCPKCSSPKIMLKKQNIIDKFLKDNYNPKIEKQVELKAEQIAKEQDKQLQKKILSEIMQEDEKLGLYEQETIEQLAKNYCKENIGNGFYPDIELAFEAGANSQQPIIDQLKRENEELVSMLKKCKVHYNGKMLEYHDLQMEYKQLIQKHNGK